MIWVLDRMSPKYLVQYCKILMLNMFKERLFVAKVEFARIIFYTLLCKVRPYWAWSIFNYADIFPVCSIQIWSLNAASGLNGVRSEPGSYGPGFRSLDRHQGTSSERCYDICQNIVSKRQLLVLTVNRANLKYMHWEYPIQRSSILGLSLFC